MQNLNLKSIFFILIVTISAVIAYALFSFSSTMQIKDTPLVKTSKPISIPKTSSLPMQTASAEEDIVSTDKEVNIEEVIPMENNITYSSIEEIEEKTEQIYNELTPENYEETLQEANEAFEVLDTHVEAMEAKLVEEMQDIEKVEEQFDNDEAIEEQPQDDVAMVISENEDENEIDITQEDVNNL